MNYWTKPRNELIDIGLQLTAKGYSAIHIAERMVRTHFTGKNRNAATRRLAAAIMKKFWNERSGQTDEQRALSEMAAQLRSEGWRPLFADDNERCFWLHISNVSVNSNGGFFDGYAEATRRAFNSATRAVVLADNRQTRTGAKREQNE